jgi:uncharacterized protein YktA (UPF0223 family)
MVIPELAYTEMDAAKLILVLAKAGLTNDEIASAVGMTIDKFRYLLEKYPDFKELVDTAKEDPNHKVEQSLFKRALGYQVKEVVQKAGKPVQVTIKEFAPDPLSCIFWLKNRSPKRWRDVIEHRHTLKDRMERAHDAIAEQNRGMLTAGDGAES